MNFPIKALPKGKDSCHANRQQSTFIAFFHGRVRKTRKSPIPAQHTQPKRTAQPPSQLTSHSTKLSSVQRPLQLAEALHYYVCWRGQVPWGKAMVTFKPTRNQTTKATCIEQSVSILQSMGKILFFFWIATQPQCSVSLWAAGCSYIKTWTYVAG